MTVQHFRALVVSEAEKDSFVRQITERSTDDLPEGEVLVQVHYSSLNYKDALSASGNRGVTRKYPHTPGIDAAGVVAASSSDDFSPGDQVIVTSYDLGMNTAGGFGQYIRVPAGWVVPCPEQIDLRTSMCYGTAGFTAALSVHQLLEHGLQKDDGDVLISGATGGVGSLAVAILAKLGFSVTAVNGRADATDYLKGIGASSVISIEEATDSSNRPMLKNRWAGSIDAVGGQLLATTIKALNPNGVVTCCGNVASPDLPLNVYPFILRGAILVGIDSQNCPMQLRAQMWHKLAKEWNIPQMEKVVSEHGLDALDQQISRMLAGEHRGRSIIRMLD